MSTKIKIPAVWIERADFDINAFMVAQGFNVNKRVFGPQWCEIIVSENLTGAQQITLSDSIKDQLNDIVFE